MNYKTLLLTCLAATLSASFALTSCSSSEAAASTWPAVKSPIGIDPIIESKIDAWLEKMSVEQKVGQMIQAEIKSISPDDAAKYHIGSILNGGGSWPTDKADGPLAAWLNMANLFYGASMDTGDDRLAIPIIWGTDAVHGHNNVVGATIFPHNIGLGAANNPSLMRDIGTATAREVAVTGIDWTFAPTVAVAKDIRWGRTYESYSQDPKVVANLGKEIILGLQGHPALDNFLSEQKVVVTAKHFIGDGGTAGGDDQGETTLSESDLFKIHGQGYVQALGVGAQTVMASFNTWNGQKIHGHKYLLTDVLKDKMGFDGLVVGDWNGHGQIPGCTDESCPQAINAGVDLIMVPEAWKAFLENTVGQVKAGDIPMARINDAVRRILRVKMRAGMFEDGKPSTHELAGRAKLIGHADHRAVARQAVRESLVLLKNENVLPISADSKVMVLGTGSDNPAYQSGGWTVTWQGSDLETRQINPRDYYKGHTTILEGIKSAVQSAGGNVETSPEGPADVAIVVLGEVPYAESEGDLASTDMALEADKDFKLIQSLKARNIPVVTVFLSGRPRGVDPLIDSSDAFVAAWLPGSEGAGVADVLITRNKRNPKDDFKGKLPFDWPASGATQAVGSPVKYKYGYGLTYSK